MLGRTTWWFLLTVIGPVALATATDAMPPAGPGADGAALHPICPTEELYASKRAARGLDEGSGAPGSCAGRGGCDDPATRDALLPGAVTVRLVVHLVLGAGGEAPAGVDASVVDEQIVRLNADFAAHDISFTHRTRVHRGAALPCIPAYNSSGAPWRSAISAWKQAWAEDPGRWINVFVGCQDPGALGTVLGTATFPWDPDALSAQGGVWINAAYFGPAHATLTHEMGHALGLLHTHHGAGGSADCGHPCDEEPHAASDPAADLTGDFCRDTPATPVNYTCADPPGTDCRGRAWTSYGPTDFANFMGYGPDPCADHFTPNQGARMRCWARDALAPVLDARPAVHNAGSPVALENHPNPFNPSTVFRFSLPAASRVTLQLYDVSGRRVANLLDAVHGAGEVEVRWSGRGLAGEVLPSGVYYARLVAAGEVRTRRVVLLK